MRVETTHHNNKQKHPHHARTRSFWLKVRASQLRCFLFSLMPGMSPSAPNSKKSRKAEGEPGRAPAKSKPKATAALAPAAGAASSKTQKGVESLAAGAANLTLQASVSVAPLDASAPEALEDGVAGADANGGPPSGGTETSTPAAGAARHDAAPDPAAAAAGDVVTESVQVAGAPGGSAEAPVPAAGAASNDAAPETAAEAAGVAVTEDVQAARASEDSGEASLLAAGGVGTTPATLPALVPPATASTKRKAPAKIQGKAKPPPPAAVATPKAAATIASAAAGAATPEAAADSSAARASAAAATSTAGAVGSASADSVADSAAARAAATKTAKPLLCEAAAQVLKKYSTGVRRIPIEDIGISPLNRMISGKHVHNIGRRILSYEGFCRFRYENGFCHEPLTHDPLAVAKYTNKWAACDPLLATVPMKPLYGCFAKSHCLSFLHAMKSGSIRWSNSSELMVPPAKAAELIEHLEKGMFFQVLSEEVYTSMEDREALKGFIISDNLDHGFALGQTEMHLLQTIHQSLQVTRPPVGMSQWDVVQSEVARSAGQRWSDDDQVALFNLAKVLGYEQVEFLSRMVLLFVDVDLIVVRPSDFHAAAQINVQAPWVKVMLLCTQYISRPEHLLKGPHGKSFGNTLKKEHWNAFKVATADELSQIETYLATVLDVYSPAALPGMPEETLGRELPAFFIRAGHACLAAKDWKAATAALPKCEAKLRTNLQKGRLEPLPAAVGGGLDVLEAADAASKAQKGLQPDQGPAVVFKDGKVQESLGTRARARGITVQCRVSHGGLSGVVSSIGDELMVTWDTESTSVSVPLDDLSLEERVPAPKGGAAARAAELDPIPEGIPWMTSTPALATTSTRSLVRAAVYQLHVGRGPGPEDLACVAGKKKTDPLSFQARRDFKAEALVVFPWPFDMVELDEADVDGESCLAVVITAGGESGTFKLAHCPASSKPEKTEAGDIRPVYPFWAMCVAPPRPDDVLLELRKGSFQVPLAAITTKNPAFRLKRSASATVNVTIPYLTNTAAVQQGSWLRWWRELPEPAALQV